MKIEQISEIKCESSIVCADYKDHELVISSQTGKIFIYREIKNVWELAAGTIKEFSIEVVKWYENLILCGGIEGEICILSCVPKSKYLNLLYTQRIHRSTLKDIVWRNSDIFTCGFDSMVNICRLTQDNELIFLNIIQKIEAHKGWVTGLVLSENCLISQGSDNVVAVWNLEDFKKLKELRFVTNSEKTRLISKPCYYKNLIAISDTYGYDDEEGSFFVWNILTGQVIQAPILISHYLETSDQLKRIRNWRTQIEVQCTAFVKEGIFVASANCVFFYSFPNYSLAYQTEINQNGYIIV
ncbi:hypothetical protein SteCoe_921 [Stentor coeruleus]|uniref:Uncharacterized protein n=1 Tax=Stentor coeruleus TaxID=5963 RepID=A0A1R2D373_9CILI|nr:hypothetical protein SteCoe_921 [Stentor coeruleus]